MASEIKVTEVLVGDVVKIADGGDTILVKSARRVGSFIQFTAFGHPASDRWYVHVSGTVERSPLTFEVQASYPSRVGGYVQLPLPFEQGVL